MSLMGGERAMSREQYMDVLRELCGGHSDWNSMLTIGLEGSEIARLVKAIKDHQPGNCDKCCISSWRRIEMKAH
jgi:hypothetical protein